MNEIAIALIGLAGVIVTAVASIITQVILSKRSQAELMASIKHQSELDDARLDAKLEKHQAVTDTRLEELTREVRLHNNFAQRIPVLEEQIRNTDTRLTNLERKPA